MTGQARPPESARPASPQALRWLDLVAVERPVLDLRPDYTALIIVADGLHPGPSDEAADALLSDAEAQARATLAGRAASDLEPVAAWRLAYQAFGAKPKRTRPSAVFILDGLAELGRDGLTTAGQDLADKLTALHPDARLSWRQIGAAPEYPKCATANGARTT